MSDDSLKIDDVGVSAIIEDERNFSDLAGTPVCLPPEVHREDSYAPPWDLWSVGCILYLIAALKLPFGGKLSSGRTRSNDIQAKSPEPLPTVYSAELREIIFSLLEKDPQKRMTARDFLNHPYIKQMSQPLPMTPLSNNGVFAPCSSGGNGIIAFLKQQNGNKNPFEAGQVRIIESSPAAVPFVSNVLDWGNTSLWMSANEPNQFLCFDFQTFRVQLTHIAFLTVSKFFSTIFGISGSNDGESWEEFGRWENDIDFSKDNNVVLREATSNTPYQMFRIQSFGPRFQDKHHSFSFAAIEFYGQLIQQE